MSAPRNVNQPVDALAHIRSLKAAAGLFLLFGWVGEPLHLERAAAILEISYTTSRRYLQRLLSQGLVIAMEDGRYALSVAGNNLLDNHGEARRAPEPLNTVVVNTDRKDRPITEENRQNWSPFLNTRESKMFLKTQKDDRMRAVWEAMLRVGILPNERTRRLAEMEHITPDYIIAHYLMLVRAGRSERSGLLVTILESGVAAPELNELGHLADCRCEQCRGLKYRKCPYCWEYPCTCAA